MEIQGFPNYLIYSDGSIFNKKKDKFLKTPKVGVIGYKQFNLCNEGKARRSYLHRLIAIHYIPNPENKPCVDHKNRIRHDNRIENLRWVSRLENNQNVGISKSNTSGHKNITYEKGRNRWRFLKTRNGIKTLRHFNTLTEALCFKFIDKCLNLDLQNDKYDQ